MKVRLYLDEDAMDEDLVEALRSRGVDVLTVGEARRKAYLDEQQLSYATEQARVIYTFNKGDFMALHTRLLTQGLSHGGIIIGFKNRYSIGEQMRRLLALIEAVPAEEMRDRLEYLSAWR